MKLSKTDRAKHTNSKSFGKFVKHANGKKHCVDKSIAETASVGSILENNGENSRSKSGQNSVSNTNTNSQGSSNTNTNSQGSSNTGSSSNTNTRGNSNTGSNSNTNSRGNSNTGSNSNTNSRGNSTQGPTLTQTLTPSVKNGALL